MFQSVFSGKRKTIYKPKGWLKDLETQMPIIPETEFLTAKIIGQLNEIDEFATADIHRVAKSEMNLQPWEHTPDYSYVFNQVVSFFNNSTQPIEGSIPVINKQKVSMPVDTVAEVSKPKRGRPRKTEKIQE